jgi:mannose-1-phosphate guanylyltransferase/mannose-6-phosphate isomerase
MSFPIQPVILSGGSGTRLWPLSRAQYPKQFLPLTGEQSLFQETVTRAAQVAGAEAPLVVSNEEQRFLVAEQLLELGTAHAGILLEPEGRNTAPAIALAALEAAESDPEALLLVLPADHRIEDAQAFADAVATAAPAAAEGALVTFGVVPSHPETGFGYIRAGAAEGGGAVLPVAEFVEKPDAERAEQYVASGEYFWNSGMFLLRADRYLAELEAHAPGIAEACRRAHAGARRDLDFIRVDAEAFASAPEDSIDYAVMEPTDRAAVVPLDAPWSDVGSWPALQEVCDSDEAGNVIQGDVISLDDRNCYLRADSRLLATAGLEDHIVVETPDAVMVAHRDRAQDVKQFVKQLEARERSEHRERGAAWAIQ